MDLETAELVKVAANAFLATKISFINAMAEVCEQAGADVLPLAEALGYDARIGRRFLSPGLGYGGGCLPKDIRGFRATAADLGVSSLESLLATVDAINLGRRERVVALARRAAGGSLAGLRVAVLGVAFKPDSDDVRDSPSLAVCDRLAAEGAVVSVHDPVAMPSAARKRPGLGCAPSVFEAAEGADLVLHLTEWSAYRAIDPAALARVVARRVIIDARCCLDAGLWREAGWTVHVLGRPYLLGLAGAGEQGSFGGLDDVGQEHGAGHRADSARHRGQPAGHLGDLGGDVAGERRLGVGPGDAHVDPAAPGLTMSAVSSPGRPAATTTMSAVLVCAARSLVPVWHCVGGRIDAHGFVNQGPFQRVALGVGQHVHTPQPLHGEGLIGIHGIVKPIRAGGTGTKITLSGAPFLLQNTSHLGFESGAQGLTEYNAQQHQQDGEEKYVAEGQAETQPASESQRLAERVHDDCSTCFSTGFSAFSGASSM